MISDKMPGPAENSAFNYIKLSFKEGLDSNFIIELRDVLRKRTWESDPPIPYQLTDMNIQSLRLTPKQPLPQIKPRTGIIGIERSLQEQQKATDESISMAFQDLKKLMEMAKDMVAISKTISAKIRVTFNDIFIKLTLIIQEHCRRDKGT